MENYCYDLAIRQSKCQNGISVTTDNVYTNIQNDTNIILAYGYTINIFSKNSNSVTISISNSLLLEPVKFNIPNDTYKTFDLPVLNGNLILLIGVIKNACTCPRLTR